ncbi:endonuclease domain-containing protein [Aeromicrobium sp. Leaf350]|uniref:endonuclease domain-containing protein n=1 Tax=Aeromicrobium sp. Leaf350 TaxID=2876565 RepID=UPI001E4813AB|nr:endonuclease domain-containing protein [Aeromicrobium sp. Leaf350]
MDTSRPFTTAQARASGITERVLGGRRYRRLFRGVHISADSTIDLFTWIAAAMLLLPPDAAVSHTTAMRLYGLDPGGRHGLEFSTNHPSPRRIPGLTLHRRLGTLHPRAIGGFPTLGPDRTFVDVALRLRLPELVAFGDHLVHRGLTTIEDLRWYADSRHLDGVRRARRIAPLVRAGVESPRETLIRLMLRFGRLPEPEVNGAIHDRDGAFLARGDLVYRAWKVVVEYDGLHHLRDPRTWQHDLRRRELLEAAGWIVIVITTADLDRPASIPARVHEALARHGYQGPRPATSVQWSSWFGA